MNLHFSLPYRTTFGQRLAVCGSLPALGRWELKGALALRYDEASGRWSGSVELPDNALPTVIEYKYLLLESHDQTWQWEWGPNRRLPLDARFTGLRLADYWRPPAQEEHELFTAAFTENLFRRPAQRPRVSAPAGAQFVVRFAPAAPRVPPGQVLCVLGSDPALGSWGNTRPLLLSDESYPTWEAELALEVPSQTLRYKYGIWDPAARKLTFLEKGPDRLLAPGGAPDELRILHDEAVQYEAPWRGAGVAVPVFSLRSEQGLGVGEFLDLKLLINWAGRTGLRLVQVLPVNDTTASHTWTDSYPYSAISVFALHPLYLNLEAVAPLQDKAARQGLARLRRKLNALPTLDYEAVMQAKWQYLRRLYEQEKASFLADPAAIAFRNEQADWLLSYAAFSALRDRFGTADFRQWPAEFRQAPDLARLIKENQPDFDEFGFYFFVQFHLDRQLREAVEYGRQRGVVLKGDLPIGIAPDSVDAWLEPELFHLDRQAGAPPDDFSTTGQNWRFPTYNWARMASDGYRWWQRRLRHLARYFDALRIDHILGFFRIWEIPADGVDGLLGRFAPALPLSRQEVEQRLGWFDEGRLCAPYLRPHLLRELFADDAPAVQQEFMEDAGYGTLRFKKRLSSQQEIDAYLSARAQAEPARAAYYEGLRTRLLGLLSEVLLLRTGPDQYHPRIRLSQTASFRELADEETRRRVQALHDDFFFHRQEEFWRQQGLSKLPPLRQATNMLICAEDLGMVPAAVPGVLQELGILSLRIQRMPAEPGVLFSHPHEAPYLSVVSPGTHDMPTLRAWWEQDRVRSQRFYELMLGHVRQLGPAFCEPWVVREILMQHLHSPAMWAIFPLQDLLAMDGGLRRANPHDEQINDPANPTHYWQYRLHLPLEELVEAVGLNEPLRELVAGSGRG